MANEAETFLNSLQEHILQPIIRSGNAQKAATQPAIKISEEIVFFPKNNTFACAVCLGVFNVRTAKLEDEIGAHLNKCIMPSTIDFCTACHMPIKPEEKMDHQFSKGHDKRINLIKAKQQRGDTFAFYYTNDGVGQSKGPNSKTMPWQKKSQMCDGIAEQISPAVALNYKIAKSVVASKDSAVSALTHGSEVVRHLETLMQFATVGVLPCEYHPDTMKVSYILQAVQMTVADNFKPLFDTKENSKVICRITGCEKKMHAFLQPLVVYKTAAGLRENILRIKAEAEIDKMETEKQ